MKKQTQRQATQRLVGIALFSAFSFAVTFVFRIPVAFLTFDAKDAVITVAAFLYGPLSGVAMSLIAALLELVTVSSTGLYGFLMNFLSSAVFSFVAAGFYSRWRRPKGAILGVSLAVAAMTAAMMLFNLLVTPLYMQVPTAEVASMIPTLLLPFNLAKGLLNAALALLLYKPLSVALSRAGLIGYREEKKKLSWNRTTLLMLSATLLMVAAALTLFFLLKRG